MNPSFQTVEAYVALLKDIITALSALALAIIAALGLGEWRKQLRGKTEYDLAQRLLRAVYQVRDAFAWVRNPFQSGAEIQQAMKEANIEVSPAESVSNAQSQTAVYQKRWQGVIDASASLDLIALEAEAIWGQEFKGSLKLLHDCLHTLGATIQTHLRDLARPPATFDEGAERKKDDIIYGWAGDEDKNPFSSQIAQAVSQVENVLRPHLAI